MPWTTRIVFNVLTDESGNPVPNEPVKATLIFPQRSREQQAEAMPITVVTATDATGRWELALIPNDQFDDPQSYYMIQEGADGKSWTHYHAIRVPSGTTAVWLGDVVLPEVPPSPQLVGVVHNVVTTLQVEGQQPLKGDVKLRAGTNIQLAQDYQQRVITINSTGGAGGGPHNLLSDVHPDTAPTTVQRGMLIVGQLVAGLVKWAGLALGAVGKVLKSNGTDVVWGDVDWNEIVNKPTTIAYENEANTFTQANDFQATIQVPRKTDPASPAVGEVWLNGKDLKYRDNQATPQTQTVEVQSNKGQPNGYAALDANAKVIQDPANAQVTPAPNKIPQAGADGKIDAGWLPTHTHVKANITDLETITTIPTADAVPKAGADGKINAGWLPVHTHVKANITDLETITTTPTADAVPKATANGKIDIGWLPDNSRVVSVGITIGDGVNAITTGFKGAIWVPVAGTITEWTVLSTDANPPTSGSIEIDILRSTYADYPTMTSMVGTGTKPNIANAQKGNGTPTGWASTAIAAGDCIGFQVTAVTSLKRVTLVLKVVKS